MVLISFPVEIMIRALSQLYNYNHVYIKKTYYHSINGFKYALKMVFCIGGFTICILLKCNWIGDKNYQRREHIAIHIFIGKRYVRFCLFKYIIT